MIMFYDVQAIVRESKKLTFWLRGFYQDQEAKMQKAYTWNLAVNGW